MAFDIIPSAALGKKKLIKARMKDIMDSRKTAVRNGIQQHAESCTESSATAGS
eukprot:CAMPEP_0169165696 /NCGR_PEP_ID=MMETSP1015-20121227/59557_1 /TAXON_ID=342587 /ORGANISM="Karlodinium micrum, Strain CCMP2283" /LENGTH=52 /DNA_ID=CAMNT_0009238319 /DNA_START=301 /DNA_END=460 /DNA_ORIENTATION=-